MIDDSNAGKELERLCDANETAYEELLLSIDGNTKTVRVAFNLVKLSKTKDMKEVDSRLAWEWRGKLLGQNHSQMVKNVWINPNPNPNPNPNQSISQSVNQSISQSVNQSIRQSVNPSIRQSVIQSFSHSVNQSISQSVMCTRGGKE